MKKILYFALLLTTQVSAQPFAAAGVGLSVIQVSPVAALEIGYRVPFYECGGNAFRGWVLAAGFVAPVDAENPVLFNLRGGKAFQVGYSDEIELLAGFGHQKVSNDDKSRNFTTPVFTFNWVRSVGQGAWVISLNGGKNYFSGTIGMRVNFY